MMELIEKAKEFNPRLTRPFQRHTGRFRLRILCSASTVGRISYAIPVEDGIKIRFRSVMGVELPLVDDETDESLQYGYGFFRTGIALDEAYKNSKA